MGQFSLKYTRNWSENFGANVPLTTLGYSVVRISYLNDAFSEILELEASQEVGQQLQQKDKKRKGKKKIKEAERPKDIGHFYDKDVIKRC